MESKKSRRLSAGVWSLVVALGALVAITFLPTSFVIQRPGPVINTLGDVTLADGESVPMIEISGVQTYPTDGTLSLTTVSVVGNRERTPSWLELVGAWFDRSRAVVPIDVIFPEGVTTEERNERNASLMVNSQQDATAAALSSLDYDIGAKAEIVEVMADGAADGLLHENDIVLAANRAPVSSAQDIREVVQVADGAPVSLSVLRGGEVMDVRLQPQQRTENGETDWLIGILLMTTYDFPIDVTIQIESIGGPSAGQMFALGIVDELTPGSLTGGHEIAGTGTIDGQGHIGPIGGIRQKLAGAKDAGAQYFLAPLSNCDEVVGHIPDGLTVISTSTLSESVSALGVISAGGDVAALPGCNAQ